MDIKIAGNNILIIAEFNYITFLTLNTDTVISSIFYGKTILVKFKFHFYLVFILSKFNIFLILIQLLHVIMRAI